EADGAGQSGGQFTVNLALCRASTNGTPGNQISNVLGSNHVQELAASGQIQLVDGQQQFTRRTQTLIDVEAAIHEGVVDQPFPAHGGTWLFEVHAHHNFQLGGKALALDRQATRVVHGG